MRPVTNAHPKSITPPPKMTTSGLMVLIMLPVATARKWQARSTASIATASFSFSICPSLSMPSSTVRSVVVNSLENALTSDIFLRSVSLLLTRLTYVVTLSSGLSLSSVTRIPAGMANTSTSSILHALHILSIVSSTLETSAPLFIIISPARTASKRILFFRALSIYSFLSIPAAV